jgi:excisionase family DNA binding protein
VGDKIINNLPKQYTTQEVAILFGITARTVQMWADSGVISVSRTLGGHRRISTEEVERLSMRINNKPLDSVDRGNTTTTKENNTFKILIVEDDQDLLKLYRMEMENWDPSYELFTVNDGYEALLIAGKKRPEIIITDLNMPYVDGFHLINVLSNNQSLKKTKVIAVTGLAQKVIEERGPLPKSVIVMQKPIQFEQLKSIVLEEAKNKTLNK